MTAHGLSAGKLAHYMTWMPLVCAGAILIAPLTGLLGSYSIYIMTLIAIYGCVATGLTLFMGYTGQISIGHSAFYGLGAYVAANLTKSGIPFPVALIVGGLLSCIAGYATGWMALRLRGFYLAVTTLALGLIAYQVFKNFDVFTGGVSGLGKIPIPSLFSFNVSAPVAYFYVSAAVLIFVMTVSSALVRSPTGRVMQAVAEGELAAQSVGVNTYWIKIHVFALSAGFAGLAGGLYAHLIRYVTPDDFSFIYSVLFLTMAIVGGLGYVYGGIVGAAVVTIAAEELRAFPKLQPLLYGAALVILVIFMPYGIVGALKRGWSRIIEISNARASRRAHVGHGQ